MCCSISKDLNEQPAQNENMDSTEQEAEEGSSTNQTGSQAQVNFLCVLFLCIF